MSRASQPKPVSSRQVTQRVVLSRVFATNPMRTQKRQNEILSAVKSRGTCSIIELAKELEVSDETIRRNIKPLIQKGLVDKIHGGIVLNTSQGEEPPFQRRLDEHKQEKEAISSLVSNLIKDGDSIMLDTGSTTAYVARALSNHQNLSVVTNCTEIARTIAKHSGNRVHITGGELRADDWAAFGAAAINFVRQFRVQYAILSIGAISTDGQFMDYHVEEAEFSRAVIEQADQIIIVADHSKFGSRAFVQVCDASNVDIIVTDRLPPVDVLSIFAELGIDVLTPEHP